MVALESSPARNPSIFMSFGSSVSLNSTFLIPSDVVFSKTLLSRDLISLIKNLKKLCTTSDLYSQSPPTRRNCSLLFGSLSPTFKNDTNIAISVLGATLPPIAMANKMIQMFLTKSLLNLKHSMQDYGTYQYHIPSHVKLKALNVI